MGALGDPDRPERTVMLRWLGHSTVLFGAGGVQVLTDPVLRSRVGPLARRATPVRPDWYAGTRLALVSHLHLDHLDPRSLRLLPPHVRLVVPAGAGRLLRSAGNGRYSVTEMRPGDRLGAAGVEVTAVPAVHPGHRWWSRYGSFAPPMGYLVDSSTRVYFAGDTDLFPEMAELRGRVDVALIPVGGWGLTLGPGHLDPVRAADAVRLIQPQVAVPIHWGTLWPVGLRWARRDLFDRPGERFAQAVAAVAPQVEVRVLGPGATTTVAVRGSHDVPPYPR